VSQAEWQPFVFDAHSAVLAVEVTGCDADDAQLPARVRWLRQGFPGIPRLGIADLL
jgi:hypothetical protein